MVESSTVPAFYLSVILIWVLTSRPWREFATHQLINIDALKSLALALVSYYEPGNSNE
jgi:hypothetical protein